MKELCELYIGSVLIDNSAVINHPVPSNMMVSELRPLYDAILTLISKGAECNESTLYINCKDERWWSGIVEISTYRDKAVSGVLAKQYAQKIKKAYKTNELKEWATDLIRNIDSPDAIENAESKLMSVLDNEDQRPFVKLKDAAMDLANHMYGDSLVLKTDIDVLDEKWKLTKGGFHIVAGRPGMGKSSFAIRVVQRLLEKDVPVLMFSLEMPTSLVLNTLYAGFANHYGLSEKMEVANTTKDKPFYINDSAGISIEKIRLISKLAKKHLGIGAIVVDYVQLVRTAQKVRREEQIAFISRSLKEIAKENDLPVIALAQLNRQAEATASKRPSLSHLRESGALEQDADSVALLYRSEYYYKLEKKPCPIEEMKLCEIIIAKQRTASTSTIEARWEPSTNNWFEWR